MYKSHRKKKKRSKQHNTNNSHDRQRSKNKENELPYSSESSEDDKNESKNDSNKKKIVDDGPYEIRESNIMGRYLVASRAIVPGQLILQADPLVVGPCSGCSLVCLGCYNPIAESHSKCFECNWPLCDEDCSGLHRPLGHSIEECSTLKRYTSPDYDDLSQLKDCYQAIVPLRCLLLKESDPDKWECINSMVAHNDIRRKRSDLWKSNQTMVVDKIVKTWKMKQYTEEEIHTICGILEVNAFEVGQTGMSIRGLYPRAFLLAHDCTPNTNHTDDHNRTLLIHAATYIERGQPITLSYAYTLQCTYKRREHLQESKFFNCCCLRCEDPTELGSYAGALNCPKCLKKDLLVAAIVGKSEPLDPIGRGSVVPTSPLSDSAPWRCDTCSDYVISSSSVKALVQRISDDYDKIDVNDVDAFEAFLHKYKNVLHTNHYLCLSAKHSLSQLYGKVDTHLIHELSPTQLQRKRDICRDLLQVFDALEPGYSRLRGVTLYELHAPLMILTTRDYEKKALNKTELRTRLKEVVKCLEESALILNMEPKDSAEGIMATAAKDALKRIKDWEKIIGKI